MQNNFFQVIWVCILCRKKQELLSKTGQWINKTSEAEGFMRPNIGGVSFLLKVLLLSMNIKIEKKQFKPYNCKFIQKNIFCVKQSLHPDPHDSSDKRPKLERARSAAEKENHPLLQRTGSGLRRQYSHDSSVDMLNPAQRQYQQTLYGSNHSPTQPSDMYSTENDPKYYQVYSNSIFSVQKL